ncbi:Harbinger transposase-derived nuclease [Macleaya cordata]|uniref:Harbinger transposase-derived nuclease n=1 Tax=Macleaya cordata TaxID=56857 RepID=A0A200QYS5_MACCD|nr:Harbinger transposase-derived nuclease [Macleaya cordata]
MDSRMLAAFLSSIISQVLLLLLLHLSPDDTHHNFSPPPPPSLFPLILHFLSTSEIATTFSLLSSSSRKRKRTQQQQPEDDDDDDNEEEDINNDPDRSISSRVPLPHIDSFKLFFRMTSATFEWLSGLLEPLLDCRDPIHSPLNLSPEIRLGIGLFRLATGSDYPEISRRFGVSVSTSRFCTKQLCRVLCTNFRFWIAFPSSIELDSVSAAFEDINGFPNCCGILDCVRFKVIKEENSDTQEFQEETIAAQIVVDSSLRILSIIAGFRGDKGDSRVLKSSTLFRDVEGGNLLNSPPVYLNGVAVPQYLIGDNGYPLLPWLMVPFVDPVPDSCEADFNSNHRKMRLPALRTLASLRNWGVLNRPMKEEFKIAVACIGACSILHNALLMREDYSALSDEMEHYSVHDNNLEENPIEIKASVIRNELAGKAREVRDSNQSTC